MPITYDSFRARVEDRTGDRWAVEGSLSFIESHAAAQNLKVIWVKPCKSSVNPSQSVPSPPVVLVSIHGDSYGAEALTFPGVGNPVVIDVDFARYDKYNRSESYPSEDYAEDIERLKIINKEAADTLVQWVSEVEEWLPPRVSEDAQESDNTNNR